VDGTGLAGMTGRGVMSRVAECLGEAVWDRTGVGSCGYVRIGVVRQSWMGEESSGLEGPGGVSHGVAGKDGRGQESSVKTRNGRARQGWRGADGIGWER
jgi:hypothetical protein